MKDPVFDHRHQREYALFGAIAAILYIIPVWYFLQNATYQAAGIVYIGTILFMFVIFAYHLKLIRRQSDYKSAWRMAVAGHIVILVGIMLSVILSLLLCLIYGPNGSALQVIFLTATIGNFGTGAFISVLCSYVIKPNQTKDETPEILQDTETIEPSSNVVHHPGITQ